MNYGLLVDVILLALFAGCVYICARSGFIKSVLMLIAVCIAAAGAYALTQWSATTVAEKCVNPLIEKGLESAFEKHMTEDTLGALDSGMDTVNRLIEKIQEKFGSEDAETVPEAPAETEESLFSDSETVAQKITDIIGGVITAALLFFVYFAFILALLRVGIDLLGFLRRIPIIGPVNTLLGFAMGIAVGYLLLAVPVWALTQMLPAILGDVELFSAETIEKSKVVAFLVGRMNG